MGDFFLISKKHIEHLYDKNRVTCKIKKSKIYLMYC
jgi:hypothetical protein